MSAFVQPFISSLKEWFRFKSMRKLFLICIVPIHIWAILMVLMDFEWIRERTNITDAIGVVAYALIFAFLESLLLFITSMIVSLLLPPSWNNRKRLAGMTWIILIVTFWAAIGQLFFVLGGKIPAFYLNWMIVSDHPLRILIGTIFPLVCLSISIPLFLILKKEKFTALTLDIIERLEALSLLYLVLDFFGLLFVIYRNIPL